MCFLSFLFSGDLLRYFEILVTTYYIKCEPMYPLYKASILGHLHPPQQF